MAAFSNYSACGESCHDAASMRRCLHRSETGLRAGRGYTLHKAFESDPLLIGTVSTPPELMHSHGLWAHAYGAEIMDEQNSDLDRRAVPHTSRSFPYLPVLNSTCCL